MTSQDTAPEKLKTASELETTFSGDKNQLINLDKTKKYLSHEIITNDDLSTELSNELKNINAKDLAKKSLEDAEVQKKAGLLVFSAVAAMADMYKNDPNSLDNIASPENIQRGIHENINNGLAKFKTLYANGSDSSKKNSAGKYIYDNFLVLVNNAKDIFKTIIDSEKVIANKKTVDPNAYKSTTKAVLTGMAAGTILGPGGMLLGAVSGLTAGAIASGVSNNNYDFSNAEKSGKTIGGIFGQTGSALKDTWNDVWGTGKNINFSDKISSGWNSFRSTVGAFFNGASESMGGSKVGGGAITAASLATIAALVGGSLWVGKEFFNGAKNKIKGVQNKSKSWTAVLGLAGMGIIGLISKSSSINEHAGAVGPRGSSGDEGNDQNEESLDNRVNNDELPPLFETKKTTSTIFPYSSFKDNSTEEKIYKNLIKCSSDGIKENCTSLLLNKLLIESKYAGNLTSGMNGENISAVISGHKPYTGMKFYDTYVKKSNGIQEYFAEGYFLVGRAQTTKDIDKIITKIKNNLNAGKMFVFGFSEGKKNGGGHTGIIYKNNSGELVFGNAEGKGEKSNYKIKIESFEKDFRSRVRRAGGTFHCSVGEIL